MVANAELTSHDTTTHQEYEQQFLPSSYNNSISAHVMALPIMKNTKGIAIQNDSVIKRLAETS